MTTGDTQGRLVANAAPDVDHFIALDRQSIRFQLAAGAFLIAVGSIVLILGFSSVAVGAYNLEMITKGAGLVVSLMGMFPFNNCWSRWERIQTLQAMKLNPAALDAEDTHELLRKLYARFLGV